MAALTLEEVESLTEIWEGFTLMDNHGVPKENCQSLDDMKERLRLHFYQHLGQSRSPEAAQEVIAALRREDEVKRQELKSIFEETLSVLKSLDDHVISHLISEGTLMEGLVADLKKHANALGNSECPILVAGETSSGKSSLLNLLLGKEVLPQRLLSCTSVICKLRYGPKLRACVHGDDGHVIEKELDEQGNPVEQLAQYIFTEGDREKVAPYKAVEIFLPLELLKTGVYIIDSPGFGENASMDKVLMDYIANNEIFAFIYVIKSDNAGGVQEDRLQRILKHIVERQRSAMFNNFDPRAAVFVSNRWDLVPEKERKAVSEDTFKKLSHSWPELDEDQVFYLSTTKAWATKMVGYVANDYSMLLDGIQRLIPRGLQRRLEHSHRWLEHFLQRVMHQVSSYLAKTRMSGKELQSRHKATELRLHKVERESDVIMKKLDKQLDKSIHNIARNLSKFLKSEDAKARMINWSWDELPTVSEDDLWLDLEPEIDCTIERRLAEILRDWDEEKKLFQRVQGDLFNTFKEEFLILESQLCNIEQLIQNDDMSLSDKSDEEATKYMSISENVDTSENLFDFNLSTLQKIALGFAAPVLVPVAMGILVGAPIFLLWDFKKWRRRSVATKNLHSYIEDPVSVVQKRAQLILDRVADLDNVSEYVYKQMEPARLYLDSMRSMVPKLVDSNRSLMDSIVQDKRTSAELQEKYLGYESTIPLLQEKVADYSNSYLRQYSLQKECLEIIQTQSVLDRGSKLTGIWSEMNAACFQGKAAKKQLVTVKTYTAKVSPMHLIMEEVNLRKARHPNVAKFLGTFEEAKGVPGFVFDTCLVPARRELFGFRALPKSSKGRNVLMGRCRAILEQVSMGLEYIHYRGLVHMELSLDTIVLVANKDQVKLTNIGEPRRADLPPTLNQETGRYVYLPPEVLRGAVYRAKGDMYSLGLMAWELWNQEIAFMQQRKTRLDQFIQTVRPSMLHLDEKNPFLPLIEACVTQEPECRLCSTLWVNEIRKVDLLHQNKVAQEDDEK